MANTFIDQINTSLKDISSPEQVLGKGLNMPFNCTNSGARKIMSETHASHGLVLTQGDMEYCGTGYENRFGELSSSIITTDSDYEVIAKVPVFTYAPEHRYYLILRDLRKKILTVEERISYNFRTEVYGYLHNYTVMDKYSQPGSIIPEGTCLRQSTAFDQYQNRTSGRNIMTAYMALDHNMEDSVIISDECSKKLSAPLFRKVEIILNENDIPLNIYGNDSVYKIFPDIGEDVKDGILMAYRREKREEAIYTQSVSRLQYPMISDDKITVKGKVIDIEINCNNIEHIQNSIYDQQFYAYYQDRIRMCNEIIAAVGPYIAQGYKLSYDLDKLYARAKGEVNQVKFVDKKIFSNLRIQFIVMEERPLGVGDKVSDRYGGKGVVSKIIPKELMPTLYNGLHTEMIKNSSTMYNRENAGQIFELELNYISMNILDRIRETNMNARDAMNEILKFIQCVSIGEVYTDGKVSLYDALSVYVSKLTDEELQCFVDSYLSKTCIPISLKPISESMNIDKLGYIYSQFPYIKQTYVQVPITDSKGNTRLVNTRRPIIIAPIYCLRLKQFAEEKFSAVSLSSTNIKNENAKSKASKNYREPNSNTPIKFGQMESGDFDHIGSEYVVVNLMLHSLSPHARRLVEEAATGDPYNVDIKLDKKSKNRSAEILRTRLKTMGYRLVFNKTPKRYRPAILKSAIEVFEGIDDDKNTELTYATEEDKKKRDELIKERDENLKKLAVIQYAISYIDGGDYSLKDKE